MKPVAKNSQKLFKKIRASEFRHRLFKLLYKEVRAEHDAAAQAVRERNARRLRLERFAADIEGRAAVAEFDGGLWSSLADFVTVYEDKRIVVTFKDGTEIEG